MMKDVYAGITLFLATYYVLVANPAILATVGVPASAALLGTFLVLIIGNLSGAAFTRTGLIIAPALGISAFFASYVAGTGLSWEHGMMGCFIAGLLVSATTFFSRWRETIVFNLPDPVKLGVKAAVGSLLAKASLDLFIQGINNGLNAEFTYFLAVLSVAIILLAWILRTRISSILDNPFRSVALHSEYILAVLVFTGLLHLFAAPFVSSYPATTELSWLWQSIQISDLTLTFEDVVKLIPFVGVIWFIVITDIPGTPAEVISEDVTVPKISRDQYIRRGFQNDGIFSFLSPIFGTTPTIYYAENLILQESGRFGRIVGVTCAIIFLGLLLVLGSAQIFGVPQISLQRLIPPVSVAPVLLFVGIFVIATSFVSGQPARTVRSGNRESSDAQSTSSEPRDAMFYFPAALTVLLTPSIGLEFSFPLSILAYWLTCRTQRQEPTSFRFITGGAILLLILFFFSLVLPA